MGRWDGKVVSIEERRRRDKARKRKEREATAVKTPQGFRSTCGVCDEVFFAPRAGVKVCGAGGCRKVLARNRLKPFTLRHFERWAGAVILDTGGPWLLEDFQRAFLVDVFAGFKQCWLLIGEGNTKTTTLAGLALYHCQHTPDGRVPVCAAARDQAFEMYLQAQGMVERSVDLGPVFTCHEGMRQIKCTSQGSRMQVYASDDRTGDGVIYTLALVDELGRHRDMRMYRTWAGKKGKREGAQIAGISAAGEPGSEFEIAREQMRQGADGRSGSPGYIRAVTGTSVLHEYAVPEDGDIEDVATAKLANPFSGISLDYLAEKRADPTMTVSHWSRMTCNRATRGANAAVAEAEWQQQETDKRIPVGEQVWAGLDVAWRRDTTALVPMWTRGDEYRLLGPAKVLTPPGGGTSLDPHLVEAALINLHAVNPIVTLVMDTTRAEQLASWIEEELGAQVIDRPQTNALAALDYERWMEALRNRWLWHSGDPALTKHVLTAIQRQLPNDKTRFDRPIQARSGSEKQQELRVIDALTAASMVHGVYAAELIGGGVISEPLVAYG